MLTPPSQPAGWFEFKSSILHLTIVSPLARPIFADVTFPTVVTKALRPQPYLVNFNAKVYRETALPASWNGYLKLQSPLTLRGVLLLPGSNPITLQSGPQLTDVDPNISVTNMHVVPETRKPIPLRVLTHNEFGGELVAISAVNYGVDGESRFAVLPKLNVSLAEHPIIRAHYAAPRLPVNFGLALGLESGDRRFEYICNLPSDSSNFFVDLTRTLQTIFEARRDRDERLHGNDLAWLVKDARTPQHESSSYRLRYIDLLIFRHASKVHFDSYGIFKSVRVEFAPTVLTTPIRQFVAPGQFERSSPMVAKSVKVARMAVSKKAIAFTAVPTGRDQSLGFTVPFTGDPGATDVEFTLNEARGVSMVPRLNLKAGDRDFTVLPEIGPQAVTVEPDIGRMEPLPLDGPIPIRRLTALSNLPQPQRYAYHLSARALQTFGGPPVADPTLSATHFFFRSSFKRASIRANVAGLAAVRDTLLQGSRPLNGAALHLDGRTIPLRPMRTVAAPFGEGTLAVAHTTIGNGRHAFFAETHGPAVVQSGIISIGRPAMNPPSDVLPERSELFSEQSGLLHTKGGVLVMPMEYEPEWRLSLVPKNVRLTGNPIFDYFRLARWRLPANAQLRVNGGLNGWLIPAFDGRAVFIYTTYVYSLIGVVVETIAILVWLFVWRYRARRT